jgi:hypothetical protein
MGAQSGRSTSNTAFPINLQKLSFRYVQGLCSSVAAAILTVCLFSVLRSHRDLVSSIKRTSQVTDTGPMAAADISQNMTAAMPKNVKAGFMVLALLMTFVTFTAADCPDAGIRCRIPASDADTTVSAVACPHTCSARVLPKRRFVSHLCVCREAVLAAAEVEALPVELRETCPLA